MMNAVAHLRLVAGMALFAAVSGCEPSRPPATAMAPPVASPPPQSSGEAVVYNWKDVPNGQEVPIVRNMFDQGGYQLSAQNGDTIVVPFENKNLYVMKFGRSNRAETYFVRDGQAPTLYLRKGDYLVNASVNGAHWYPISEEHRYERPVYVSLAPSWADYLAMGWYAGMVTRGGMWGYSPFGASYTWMPGFGIHYGGSHFTTFSSYHTYYNSHPGYSRIRTVHNYTATPAARPFGSGRSTGSFGGTARTTGGSFSSGRTSATGGGSFGDRPSAGGSFGGSGSSGTRFGSAPRPIDTPSGSFGSVSRPSGGLFGGGRSSFGSGRSSFGGGRSFGGFRRR
jgi:hypothetical protein